MSKHSTGLRSLVLRVHPSIFRLNLDYPVEVTYAPDEYDDFYTEGEFLYVVKWYAEPGVTEGQPEWRSVIVDMYNVHLVAHVRQLTIEAPPEPRKEEGSVGRERFDRVNDSEEVRRIAPGSPPRDLGPVHDPLREGTGAYRRIDPAEMPHDPRAETEIRIKRAMADTRVMEPVPPPAQTEVFQKVSDSGFDELDKAFDRQNR